MRYTVIDRSFHRMARIHLLASLCFAFFAANAWAEKENNEITFAPLHVSFVPGFGTHPKGNVEVDVSFNILAGRIARLNKFEIGTLLNWNTESMGGIQLSGLVNLVNGPADGIQMAGLANVITGESNGIGLSGLLHYAADELTGIYGSGLINCTPRDLTGIAFSGLANYAGRESTGILLSGAVNCSRKNSTGIYLSGLANCAGGQTTGIILSGLLNYSEDFEGIEMSLVNVAEDVEGIQAGLVNYARSVDGIPFGLFSYVENVPLRLDAWASETAALTVAIRSGNERYFPLIVFGINPYNDPFHWMAGWGFGREYRLLNDNFIDFDGLVYYVGFDGRHGEDTNNLYKLRLLYGHRFSHRLALYGGPTLNLLSTNVEKPDDFALWGPSEATWVKGGRSYYLWPGLIFGIRF